MVVIPMTMIDLVMVDGMGLNMMFNSFPLNNMLVAMKRRLTSGSSMLFLNVDNMRTSMSSTRLTTAMAMDMIL